MKQKKSLIIAVMTLLISGLSVPALAAEVGNTTTEGDVTFTGADASTEGGKPSAPDDNEDKTSVTPDPGEDSHTNGPLRIETVPTLHFGTQKVSNEDQTYDSLWNTGTIEGKMTKVNLPLFAQVRDETAKKANNWELKVQQKAAFKPQDSSSTSPALKNTRVHIYSANAYNSIKTRTDTTATVTALAIEASKSKEIPIATDLTIMTGSNTTGSDSSVVFSATDQYNPASPTDPNNPYAVTGSTNKGLRLFVPGTDVAYAEKYTATFLWTLADTL